MSLSAKSFSLFKRDVFLFLTNLVTGVVIARKLGPSALGLWVILQMVIGYAESFGRIKFDAAAVYFLGKQKYRIGEVVFTLNMLAIVTSALIVGAILWQFEWVYGALFANSDTDVRMYMAVILLQIPLQFLSLNYAYLYIHREDVATYNRMVMIKSLLSSLVAIVLLLVFDLGLVAVVSSSIFAVFAGLAYGVAKFGKVEKSGPAFNPALVRDLFSYGSKLYVTGIITHMNASVTRLIMVLYVVPAQVAYFAMAQNLGQLLNKVPDAVNLILFPRISKMDAGRASAKLAANAFRVVLLILAAVSVFAFFLIEPFVRIVYGSAFVALVEPFRIMLPGLVLAGAGTVLDPYFSGVGRPGLSGKITVVPLAIQTTAALLLVPAMGVVGGALAVVLALFALCFIQLFVFLRLSGCTFRSDLLIRRQDFDTVFTFIKSAGKRLFQLK